MTIVIIITDFGSFNNFLVELCLKIAKDKNNNVHVVCSRDKIIDKKNVAFSISDFIHFHYVNIPRKFNFLQQLKSALSIYKIVKNIQPDLVHAHFTTGIFTTVLFKPRGIIYWGTFHGLGINISTGLRKIIFYVVEKLSFTRLDRIFVVNNQDLKFLQRSYLEKVTKYHSLGFGCDLEKFDIKKYTLSDQINIKNELNANHHYVITFIGRFVQFKGFDIVVRSFLKLNSQYPQKYKLLLIGGLDPIHITGLTKSEKISAKNCIDIVNLGYQSNVEKYLSVTDVFLFPSKKEGLPTCIMEALSMGVPVITCDTRGNSDLITENYNGLLLKPGSDEVNDIICYIKKLSSDKELEERLKANALLNREKYSRERFVDEHIDMYKNLLWKT